MSILSVVKEALEMVDTLGKLPTSPETFMAALDTIFQVVSVILRTDGQAGWHQKVNEVMGKEVFTTHDENRLAPLVNFLVQIKYAKSEEPLENLIKQQGGGYDLDSLYASGIDYIKKLDEKVKDFSSKYGIVELVKARDLQKDMYPFDGNLSVAFPPWTTPLGLIPLPFRTLLFMVHAVLDLVRLAVSVPGYDSPFIRKTLSVALAALELLRGDWKTALLSMSGFFASSLVYIGFVGKLFLEVFYMIAPPLQDDIIFGTFRVTKSILIGFLFNIFQITAIKPVRDQVMKAFEELAKREQQIDKVLGEAGLPGRAKIQSPFNTTGAHAFLEDRLWNCSQEFQTVIAAAKQNKIVEVILSLVNIPVSEDDLESQCKRFAKYVDDQGYVTWTDLLKAEGLMKLSDMKAAAELDTPDPVGHPDLQKELEDLKKEMEKAMLDVETSEREMEEAEIQGDKDQKALMEALAKITSSS
jgi:heterodisulfide reductase subunit C